MALQRRTLLFAALGIGIAFSLVSGPQALQAQKGTSGKAQEQEVDPLKRERSDKEKFATQKAVRQELKGAYKTWLSQDVTYIISDEERKAFSNLANDEERDAFIEQFWLRRNPSPDSPENAFREEHYRRIAYANEHFAAGLPGWKTDRGRVYISWGPPDSIDSHAGGGLYDRPMNEGGGTTSTFPFEVWQYRYLEGVGENVELEFVDSCQCGDYHYTIDRAEKDALLMVPNAGLTLYEQQGKSSRADRFHEGIERLGKGPAAASEQSKQFDRLQVASKIMGTPPVKFKDLEIYITEHKLLNGPPFAFDVRTDFVKITESSVLVPITLQMKNRDMTFQTKEGVSKAVVNILGKVTTLTHKTVQTFEDTVEVSQPAELLAKSLDKRSVYWKALPLLPGLYRLDIVVKDVYNPDHVGLYGRSLEVPAFHDEKLATSTLILADTMKKVSSHEIGSGNFVIGETYVRPRVSPNLATPVSYKRDQPLNFWMQVYNLGIDEATKSNQATVNYQIAESATGTVILEKQVDSKELGAHSDQLTVEKTLPIAGLQPGKYKVTIKVVDSISKQEVTQSATFIVE